MLAASRKIIELSFIVVFTTFLISSGGHLALGQGEGEEPDSGETSPTETPFFPEVGGSETELFTIGDAIYYFDFVVTGTDGGLIPTNLELVVYRYTLAEGNIQGTWEKIELENQPPLRTESAIASVGDKVYFFGGGSKDPDSGADIAFNDLHEFEIIEEDGTVRGKFTKIDPADGTSAPSPRVDALALTSENNFWIIGGQREETSVLADVHRLNLTSKAWTETQRSTGGAAKVFTEIDPTAQKIVWIGNVKKTYFFDHFDTATLPDWIREASDSEMLVTDSVLKITTGPSKEAPQLSTRDGIVVTPDTVYNLKTDIKLTQGGLKIKIFNEAFTEVLATRTISDITAEPREIDLLFNSKSNTRVHIRIDNDRPAFDPATSTDPNEGISVAEIDFMKVEDIDEIYLLGKKRAVDEFSLWTFDFLKPDDPWQEIDTNAPTYRDDYAYTFDAEGNAYIFGGTLEDASGTRFFSDVYQIKDETFFHLQPTTETVPSPRAGSKMSIYKGALFAFGGYGADSEESFDNEVWSFDLSTNVWVDRSFPLPEELEVLDIPQPDDFEGPEGPGIFQGDVVITDPARAYRYSTFAEGEKVKCGLFKKKDRVKVFGSSRSHFIFKYGNGANITAEPINTISQDNKLLFNVDLDGGGKRIANAVWQVEGVKGFKGFDRDFFRTYINPISGISVRGAGGISNPTMTFNFNQVNLAVPVTGEGKITTYTGQNRLKATFSYPFPPGHYRLHVLVVSQDADLQGAVAKYDYARGLRASACGKTRNVPPGAVGAGSPGERYMPFYYDVHLFEFSVPEIKNFTDVVTIDSNSPYLEEGYLNEHTGQPPNLTNSMRPIIYGEGAGAGSELVAAMGKVHQEARYLRLQLNPLHDNPFKEIEDIKRGSDERLRLFADKTGRFAFQPLNLLPYNSNELIRYYYLYLLTIDKNQNVIGAPPVKIAITQERLPPRIFNFKNNDTINIRRPVFLGGYLANKPLTIGFKGNTFQVTAGYDGNFKFTLPDDLAEGPNDITISDSNDPEWSRTLTLNFDPTDTEQYPYFTNIFPNNNVFTNLPVFNGVYKPDGVLGFVFDEGRADEVTGTVQADINGHFIVQRRDFMQGTISDAESGGLHSLRVFDGDKQARVDFRVTEKHLPLPANIQYVIAKKDGILTLVEGGTISVNNSLRLFLNTRDKVTVKSPVAQLNIPQGSNIYHHATGYRESVTKGGVFDLQQNDVVILPPKGGVLWVEDAGLKEISVPPHTIISAFVDEASFIYRESGEIVTFDTVKIRTASQERHVSQMDIETYYTLPFFKVADIFNYKSGETIAVSRPTFMGTTVPNSIVEVWRSKTGEKSAENDFEHLVGTTTTDSFGRFNIRVTEPLEVDTEYEFKFVNRIEQSPAIILNLKTASTLTDTKEDKPYRSHESPYRSTRLNPQHEHTLIQRLPSSWKQEAF